MFIPLVYFLSVLFVKKSAAVTGYYSYQVAEEGQDLELYCLTSGKDIKWSRTVNGVKENLRAPDYEVSSTYRCGNPYMCGGYDVKDTKVCLRSTLRLRRLQQSDSATYFCQEGSVRGGFSFAYVLTVYKSTSLPSLPHIYDFEPLRCNNTDWYGCIATKNSVRYEFYVESKSEKITLEGDYDQINNTRIGEQDVQYLIRDNYIALNEYSILQGPAMKFGCRAFDRTGRFTEFSTVLGKTFGDLDPPQSQEAYEAYLVKWIGIGIGGFVGTLLLLFILCKLRKRCGRERRHSVTYTDYTGIDRQGVSDL